MTQRGLPIVDGAAACPFVALEDDRDERLTRPDHRHRCYAEVRPASRALAHQEAYCLSSAFPACPTFQDWARREAARARTSPSADRAPEPVDLPPPRPSQRDWAAPPPWSDEPGGGAAGTASTRPEPPSATPAGTPPFLSNRDRPPTASGQEASAGPPSGAGLAQSSSAALLGASAASDDRWVDADEDDHELERHPASSAASGTGRRSPSGRRPSVGESRRATRSLGGPSWERPQRYEAYPTLKTRMGMPNVPRVAVGFLALSVAALALFLIPPMIIRPGGGADTGSQPTPPASGSPSASLAPTTVPSPTPQIYVIVSGDTLFAVAKTFGITIEDLLAANPSINDQDKISIGQEIVIPTPLPSEVIDSGEAVSPAPSSAP